jgi:Mrp family chromosome partitioning ATPase
MASDLRHQQQRTFGDYLAIIRRRWWIAVLPILVVPVAAYFYSASQPKIYGATSEVLLIKQDLGTALEGLDSAASLVDDDRFAQTQSEIARVPEVAERALAGAGVTSLTVDQLLLTSSVRARGNADLLAFTVDHPNPDIAISLATAYARAFSRFRLELDTANFASARQDLERRLAVMRRQGTTGTALYSDLATKAQELRTLELLQTEQRLVRIPESAIQVAPKPRRNAILGVMLGLLLGLAAALLWETLDKRIRDEDEIQLTLGLPLLGRLPAPLQQDGRDRLAMLDNPGDAEAEAIRRFRSNVEFANLDHDNRVVMVTSSLSGEGKSVAVSNLAVALARAGRRVVLVDLDLRRPKVGPLFGLGYRPGLTDVAIERVNLEQALVEVNLATSSPVQFASRGGLRARQTQAGDAPAPRTADAQGHLWLLPAGFLPASPGELVGTQAVANILATLRERVDYVLVDAPPLLAVSDAVTLSRRVDGIFVIVRRGMVDRPVLRELARQLEANPARKLGFVLAGVEATEQYGAYAYGPAERMPDLPADARPSTLSPEVGDILDAPAGGRRSGG